ncbi:hypothetical protein SAMN05920897_1326 [Alkalispirochaeta americana]|uniref:Nucleotidyltransferase n=1 Tax=Alkalispirochaeta americana TaxID=159291 RepID=A0A1N6XW58_9SPIO|nr:hypothetical protein [Alkalispirochaeta americana]SIR06524.1 hypothetical protein SAMN05920897_1326 [Alkalispirochaeta americana]
MSRNGLQKYIERILRPTKEQSDFLMSKIASYKSVIEHNSELSLKECRPAGSFNKKTMLRYNPELDLVLILNKHHKYSEFPQILNRIAHILSTNFSEIDILDITKVSVKASFSDRDEKKYDFDIVPTFWLNSPLQYKDVKNKRAYQGMTSIWNNEYILSKAKEHFYFSDLSILIKDWKNECGLNCLKSYIIELIIASALEYRNISEESSWESDLVECFKEIVSMTDGSPIYPVGYKYFNPAEDLAVTASRRVIIDAGEPYKNLADEYDEDFFRLVKSESTKALNHIKNKEYDKVFNIKGRLKKWDWNK